MLLRSRPIAVFATACAALLTMAGSALAATYTVDSTADLGDAALNGVCADTSNDCTLRAAIEEANNAASVTDTINFAGSFDGTASNGTITIGSNLPAITDPVMINGGHCSLSSDSEPCAGIAGTGTRSVTAFQVNSAGAGTTIENLAFSNLNIGVLLAGSSVVVEGGWFGISLDESTTSAANNTGVVISGASSTVGGTTAAARNLFAQNLTAGVLIQGGDSNRVEGNYFGTNRAGSAPVAGFQNGDGIAIFGISGMPSDNANGNVVGGSHASSSCDGSCNLIANVIDDGIDLGAQSVGQLGALSTIVKGNYIGLALNGSDGNGAVNTSGNDGIDFGSVASTPVASQTTVGGSNAMDRNYIGGNPTGIDTHQVTDPSTIIRNNYIGVQPDGTGAVSNAIDSLDVAGATTGSIQVLNNLIGGNGAAGLEGISAYGRNVIIKGNTIGVDAAGTVVGFGGPAIDVQPAVVNLTIGGINPGDGNVIAGGGVAGILDQGQRVTIQGNSIGTDAAGTASYGNAGPGILATGTPDSPVPATIGGGSATAGNLISNSGSDAIRVTRVDGVEISRNTGSNNVEQFIDLENPSGPGNNFGDGAAEGLQAPVITNAGSTTQISGTAQPGATLRVYTKSSGASGELGSQLATVVADGSGHWTAAFGAQSEGQRLAITQAVALSVFPNTPETSEPITVQIDMAPPAQPSIAGTTPGSPSNDDTPAINGTAEAGSTVRLYSGSDCSGAVLATGTAATFAGMGVVPTSPIPHDAVTTFRVTATDAAGNTSSCSPGFDYAEDSTGPALTIDSVPQAYTNDPDPTLTFHASDANGPVTFQCAFTGPELGGPGSCSSPYDFGGGNLGDGAYSVNVMATDSLGNQTPSADIDFTVDTIAPVTVIDSAPAGTTSDNTPTLVFHTTDLNGAIFSCRVDSGAAAACSSPTTFGPLADGPHTIWVLATDPAGNLESSAKSASFSLSSVQAPTPVPTPPAATPAKKKCKKKKRKDRAASAAKKKCKKKKR
jgi:hypothetical protein